ncbi:PPE family protein [Nocardia cyriacigeorgica]|uniref:PPE family protein n=1 Tax=Nocardia cyriacigeorgica TaxID=135487 RepID=A0A6P1D673_9NOCA|nr:PPE domain-containing protein [Nocardia cyriacigeorgica]NEW38290.1 PPE family protein [Nocardia cyriacigeorgica]NEW44363.1 PPE family protein [Nocardia cyriacigeorgica]NEW49233.1 PPE family protein [Nocardia cyriacigeorgica]NEW58399.1 PPE family protein [Nocardia cyriacigeorgica]
MTAGITGVFWLPRMAEFNSVALNAGAHAVPISAAATSWGTLTAAWVDATATVTRVMAEVGVGLQSINGIGALARLGGFTAWAGQQGIMAATMGSKAAANATAYTVASLAMPSLPEIAAVNAAYVASANPAGAMSGAYEAAEVVKRAMDIRAALVMETYEAATSATVVTPGEFINPPPIANGAGSAEAASNADQAFQSSNGDPVQTALAAAGAVVNNPAISSAVTQVANVAGSVATSGVSTVGNLGANAIAAATSSGAPGVASMAPMSIATGGAAAAAGASTRAAGMGTSVGMGGNSTFKVPEGWGAPPLSGGAGAALPVTEVAVARTEPAAPIRPNTAPTSPLMGRGAANSDDDETEHNGADYLRADHFTDGRLAADGVIGGDPAGTAK